MVKEGPTTVVFVKPVKGKWEARATKQDLLAALYPGKEGLKIRNVRQAVDSRLVVEARDWKTVERMKGSKLLADRGLVRLEPRVIVYDVDVGMNDADFVEEGTLEEFKREFRPVFKKGRRGLLSATLWWKYP